MQIIVDGLLEALRLIFSFDAEVFEIVCLSLQVSFVSLFFATVIGIPLGITIARHSFAVKHVLMRIIYTLMGLPPVLCGLFVYILFMRRGPLGFMKLNYTVGAMIVAQIVLITPIIMGITINVAHAKQKQILLVAKTLGANRKETFRLLLFELRYGLFTAMVTGFSRAISEVGAVMIVGGNIVGKTRVMTTYISQLKGMGEFERALAIGIILLILSFVVNSILYHYQKDTMSYES